MDVKSMARSKRSHTKQHQPRKPHRPATHSTTSFPSSSSKDPKDLNKEDVTASRTLISNLERYYDSDEGLFCTDHEFPGGLLLDASKTDVVKPKSKGADFGFLLSDALSQSPANFTDSYDSLYPDFSQGRGSMLSVSSENILSWTGGDDFLMEDDRTTNQQASCLSVDLHALSVEFERILHARRLFLEEEILPAQMRDSQRLSKMAWTPGSSDSAGHTTNKLPWSFWQEKQPVNTDSLGILDPKISFNCCIPEAKADSIFEAKPAEAELDMLLDSFTEEDFFDSPSNSGMNVSSAASREETGASLLHANYNMNKDIDDLVKDTSKLAVISQSIEVNATTESMAKPPDTAMEPLVIEDFESWLDTLP